MRKKLDIAYTQESFKDKNLEIHLEKHQHMLWEEGGGNRRTFN